MACFSSLPFFVFSFFRVFVLELGSTRPFSEESHHEMQSANFNDRELEILRKCLVAAGEGPFLNDDDFETIFCLRRANLLAIGKRSGPLELSMSTIRDAIRGSINAILMWAGWQDDDQEGARLTVLNRTGGTVAELEQLERRLGDAER